MYYFDEQHPYVEPKRGNIIGVYKVTSLEDYKCAKEHLKDLRDLYEQLGAVKEEEDEESIEVSDAIEEQESQMENFSNSINTFDSKHLSSNIEYLLKQCSLKVSDLESLLNVSAGYISRTMGAESKKRISIDIVWMIAELFKVNVDDLLNRDLMAPTKDLKTVVDFVSKVKTETDEETIHWSFLGNKFDKKTGSFFRRNSSGNMFFAPSGECEGIYEVQGIYSVRLSIGQIYLVELNDFLDEQEYRIYLSQEEEYAKSIGSGYEISPLSLMIISCNDETGLILAECNKLRNAIEEHKKDFVLPDKTKDLINQYLNPDTGSSDFDDLPFN